MASGQLATPCGEFDAIVSPRTNDELGDRTLLDRFVKTRDEAAFAAIVERHAGMVLGICRRVLRNAHDAEDACQAAFLVLARKADSVRKKESLASWLHGVAFHVATNLKRDLGRRDARHAHCPETDEADTIAEIARREEQAMIDEELARLAERYRAPLVLCYLEGRTRDEAAKELGWTVGKLRRRLERGRELLRRRLTRRGLTFSTAMFAVALTQSSASAAAPSAVVASTVKAVVLYTAGSAAATAGISATTLALTESMLKALLAAKIKTVACMVAIVLTGASVVPIAKRFISQVLAANSLQASDWPGWRGPTGMGSAATNDLPLHWGGQRNKNVLWTIRINLRPFQSYSSPIVCRDRLFVTGATPASDRNQPVASGPTEHWVACYRRTDGKLLWETPVAPGPWLATDHFDGYAVPTPVTDGKYVYAWFGSAVMAALDFDGHVIWRKERAGPYHFGGSQSFCSSPLLYEDTVLQLCDQNDGASFLMAVDKRTGDTKWEKKRPAAFSTDSSPILIKVNDRWQLVVSATNVLQGLDPTDGEPIWWCNCPGHSATPVYGSGIVVTGSGVAVDPTGRGDVTKTHVMWNIGEPANGPSSPIIVGDYVYRIDNEGILKCRKLATGQMAYKERLPGLGPTYEVSPFSTPDGRIYFMSWSQKSYVIQAGPVFELLATNEPLKPDSMDCYTSPAVSGNRIFLKAGHLCCIGDDGPANGRK